MCACNCYIAEHYVTIYYMYFLLGSTADRSEFSLGFFFHIKCYQFSGNDEYIGWVSKFGSAVLFFYFQTEMPVILLLNEL